MTATTESDIEERLIVLVKQGDPAAMRKMYSTYVRYLAAVCSRYIPNDDDAKDVVQESFIRIFSGIRSFEYRGKASLKGWLTRVVVNESLRFLHHADRMKCVAISGEEHDLPEEEPDIDAIPSSVIFRLIRDLPDGYRTVFNLYVIEQKSHKEIAAMLNIKESSSASQLHRAKAMLAARIRQYNNLIPTSI